MGKIYRIIRWIMCFFGKHEYWCRARIGVFRAEDQCINCGKTVLYYSPEYLIKYRHDVYWYESPIVRKHQVERVNDA